jgi:hypothetical protein
MKKDKKEPPKLEQFCHFHENNLATYICHRCGKSICYYCQKNYGMPYMCPECMPVWWEKKVKQDRILCFGPLLVLIIVIVSLAAYAILTEPDYEDDDYKYSSIYIEDEGIIPVLNTVDNPNNNRLDLTLKIYATNRGNKNTDDVFIELYVMQNGTSRAEESSSTGIIKKDKTRVFYINTTLLSGEYDLQLIVWEDGRVVEKGIKTVRINQGDIQNIKAYEILEDHEVVRAGDEEAKAESGAFFAGDFSFFGPIMIFGAIILAVVALIMYRERTKPPSQRPRPPMPQPQHFQYQQSPPSSPK